MIKTWPELAKPQDLGNPRSGQIGAPGEPRSGDPGGARSGLLGGQIRAPQEPPIWPPPSWGAPQLGGARSGGPPPFPIDHFLSAVVHFCPAEVWALLATSVGPYIEKHVVNSQKKRVFSLFRLGAGAPAASPPDFPPRPGFPPPSPDFPDSRTPRKPPFSQISPLFPRTPDFDDSDRF